MIKTWIKSIKTIRLYIAKINGVRLKGLQLGQAKGGIYMPNIVLTRIDERLIHGQVATQWSGVVGANLLLVANDKVATDTFRQGLMDMAAPSYAQTR